MKHEELVSLFKPCRSLLDRAARDVDREVIARIGSGRRLLEANRRRPQHDLGRAVEFVNRQTQAPTPEGGLGRRHPPSQE